MNKPLLDIVFIAVHVIPGRGRSAMQTAFILLAAIVAAAAFGCGDDDDSGSQVSCDLDGYCRLDCPSDPDCAGNAGGGSGGSGGYGTGGLGGTGGSGEGGGGGAGQEPESRPCMMMARSEEQDDFNRILIYDDDGKLAFAEQDDDMDGSIDFRITYQYDEQGYLVIRETDNDLDGDPDARITAPPTPTVPMAS
jgi:hypothetical protein